MLAVVSSRRRWLRRHVVDVAIVVLTPPFLVSVVQSVRLLRLLRLLRLMRLAPLVRALFSAEGLRYAALLTLLTPWPAGSPSRALRIFRSAMGSTGRSRR